MNSNQFGKAMNTQIRNAHAEEPIIPTNLIPWFVAEEVTSDDVALCRNTKPLIEVAYNFFRNGVACRVEGRDIGDGLIQLANKWKRISTLSQLADRIEEYKIEEMAKWAAKENAFKVESIEDRCQTLLVIIDHLINNGLNSVSDLVSHIRSLFSDTPEGEKPKAFTLSTIHKSKGREWNRVYFLRRDLLPSKYAKQPWQLEQESNLEYVAITRAKVELIYVQ
jgi:superfamily I DNA/RNA helicase